MIDKSLLNELFKKYDISYERIETQNPYILIRGQYYKIIEILEYLFSIGVTKFHIEKNPTILYSTNKENIENNYSFLINKTILNNNIIFNCLNILSANNSDLRKNYYYLKKELGQEYILECPTVLTVKHEKSIKFREFFSKELSLKDLKKLGGGLLVNGNLENIKEIIKIPYFKNHKITQKILLADYQNIKLCLKIFEEANLAMLNNTIKKPEELISILELPYWKDKKYAHLLTPTLLYRTKEEIIDILELPYWKEEKYQHLITPLIFMRSANEIVDILNLPFLSNEKYVHLLEPSIFYKTADNIKKIIQLPHWEQDYFKKILTPTIFRSNIYNIIKILELPYWKEEKFKILLGHNIFYRTPSEIKEIIEMDYWKDDKFKSLLTSTIFSKKPDEIRKILNLKIWNNPVFYPLLKPSLFLKNAEEIEHITKLKYWKSPRFKNLITPTILNRTATQIEEILSLSYWKQPKYQALLSPTYF